MISHTDPIEDGRVQVKVHGACGTILLNRPEKCNAICRSMLEQINLALSDLHQEKKVRAVVLTGAGNHFSAGTDLSEIRNDFPVDTNPISTAAQAAQQTWFQDCQAQQRVLESILRFPKPVIAAVNGAALGFAATLVLASDIVIGCENATVGFPETARGLVSGFAAPLLSFRLGTSIAADRLLRGDSLGGSDSLSMGIFHLLVKPDVVWARAQELATEQAKKSATAVAMSKRMLNETVGERLFTQLSAGAAATASARTTEEAVEGVNAFLEKREPEWP